MPEIQYHNPEANMERGEDAFHTVEMVDEEGEVLGRAEIHYYSKPIPFYQVTDIYTEPEYQGQGVASKVMGWIEHWLQEKRKPGFLVDAIDTKSPASGFYERRGWQAVPGDYSQFVFNLPKSVQPDIFVGVHLRGNPVIERDAFKKLHGLE